MPTSSSPTTIAAPPRSTPATAPPRALCIGIDARAAAEVPAGRGRVVRELLRALNDMEQPHRYILYARQAWSEPGLDTSRFQWRLLDAKDPWWHVRAARAANAQCDVFLSSNSYLTSRFLRIPCVPIVYDLATFDAAMRPKRRSQAIERLTLGGAVKRSAKLLAISQSTAEALIGRYPGAASRTVVAPLGVSPALEVSPTPGVSPASGASGLGASPTSGLSPAQGVSPTSGLSPAQGVSPTSGASPAQGVSPTSGASPAQGVSPASGMSPALNAANGDAAPLPAPGFVLAVGTLEPRKNLPRLVEAYAALPGSLQQEHPLVVVGAKGWETGGTMQALRSLGERCEILGYVSDAALAELYGSCAVFCYPSLGEGFGLPVLEAMAAGATVLTSDISSLPEVGGDAVAYASPTDVQSISAQLQRLLRDDALRAQLSTRARARAKTFSWETFAQTTLTTLEEAAASAS